ncbi:MAG: serine/threonine-protein phosphatase [Rhodocyclaceae bacterium]|nr:serine/threonine-protein phosphatase [Rhodocyclaceae bacterium]
MKPNAFRFEMASLSDHGRVRTLNEDGVAVNSEHGFAVVTDGMGGHRAGDLASRMALEAIVRRLNAGIRSADGITPEWISETVILANTAIHATASRQQKHSGMGSTLALAVCHGHVINLAHVGDSRIYRLRDGRLELLTRDDSIINDQVEMGIIAAEEAADSHNRHFVTQALGMAETVAVHLREEDLRSGDVYLLCTDGLNDLVGESDIEVIVDALKTNLHATAEHLVQLANDCGGYDNITVALIRVCDEAPVARQGWLSRLFGRAA